MFDYLGEDNKSDRDKILQLVKDFFKMINISNFRIYLTKIEIIDKEVKIYKPYLEEYLNRYIKGIKVDYIEKSNVLEIKYPINKELVCEVL